MQATYAIHTIRKFNHFPFMLLTISWIHRIGLMQAWSMNWITLEFCLMKMPFVWIWWELLWNGIFAFTFWCTCLVLLFFPRKDLKKIFIFYLLILCVNACGLNHVITCLCKLNDKYFGFFSFFYWSWFSPFTSDWNHTLNSLLATAFTDLKTINSIFKCKGNLSVGYLSIFTFFK